MTPCIQIVIMKNQKTYQTATLGHRKKHLTIHQSKFDQESVKRKRLKNKSTITVNEGKK